MSKHENKSDIQTALKVCYKALDDKFGKNITVLDIRGLSVLSDYFIIADGNNVNQVKAMAEECEAKLHEVGYHVRQAEGKSTANWVLLDFSDFIVHIFDSESRAFYSLERIWSDAKHVDIQ